MGEAQATRFALKVGAFGGDSEAFARYSFAEALPHLGEPRQIGQARTVNSVLEIWSAG